MAAELQRGGGQSCRGQVGTSCWAPRRLPTAALARHGQAGGRTGLQASLETRWQSEAGQGSGAKSLKQGTEREPPFAFLGDATCHGLPSLTLVLCSDVFSPEFLCRNKFPASRGPSDFETVTRQWLGWRQTLLGPWKSDLMNSQNLCETIIPSFVLLETFSTMRVQG